MNKTAIKNFAIWARNKLIADITFKAGLLGVTEDGIAEALSQSTNEAQFFDIGTRDYAVVRGEELRQRTALVSAIRTKEKECGYQKAYQFIVEKVAYTWFNRLIAIRFMEVNDYLPGRVRVLSSETPNKTEPDIVTHPFDGDIPFSADEQEEVLRMKDENRLDELFRRLFIRQCYQLHEVLPRLFDPAEAFDRKNDYMELLLTISFTDKDGVLWHLVHDIPEKDFRVRTEEDDERQKLENIPEEEMPAGQVEIIGWLYQYYNTELNGQVYDGNMSKSRIPKELLPAATTIYTPDWAVRYMVENSIGRTFVNGELRMEKGEFSEEERIEKEKAIAERMGWKYYLPEAPQSPETRSILNSQFSILNCESLRCIDPCMGSGHILVYLFDVLMRIYQEKGWDRREAVRSIVSNNLFGLDIDERAAQMAYFAVMMKARQYDRRFLERGIAPCVYAIGESNGFNRNYLQLFGDLRPAAERLLDNLTDAKEYGSILKISLTAQELQSLREALDKIRDTVYDNFFDSARREGLVYDFNALLTVAEALAQKYDVVVTNPPYLGSSRFSAKLDEYVKKNFPDSKADLSMVMYQTAISKFAAKNGYVAFITTSSWMFLSSFEKVRLNLQKSGYISSLVDFGTELFDGKVGHNPIVAWVTRATQLNYKMTAIRLVEYCYSRRDEKEPEFFNQDNRYVVEQSNFSKIPGSPVAYWVSNQFIKNLQDGKPIRIIARARSGAKTGKNELFIRFWWEIERSKLYCSCHNYSECIESMKRWFPYNKGGEAQNWYGNRELVVDFFNGGENIRIYSNKYGTSIDLNAKDVYFLQGITWTALTSSRNTFRFSPFGSAFDSNKGPMIFPKSEEKLYYLLALFISPVAQYYFKVFNPTLSLQNGDVDNLPVIWCANNGIVSDTSKTNVVLAKDDWDSFETSWDFKKHPLI